MTFIEKRELDDVNKIILESYSYKEVLKKLGVHPLSGNNRKVLHQYIHKNNIDISHFNKNIYAQSKILAIEHNDLQNIFDSSSTYKEVLKKIGYTRQLSGSLYNELYARLHQESFDMTRFNENAKDALPRKGDISKETSDYYSKGVERSGKELKKRLLKDGHKIEQCEICGIVSWNNLPISFHIHHKDGDHLNNELDNLQLLCPNCHSQTDTYAGRNAKKDTLDAETCPNCGKRKDPRSTLCHECSALEKRNAAQSLREKKYNITRDIIKDKIRNTPFTVIGREYGVSDRTIRDWCESYGLPSKSNEIKSIPNSIWVSI